MSKSNIGMVGLAVMGSNLARNMANHGFKVSCWNYTRDLTDKFFNGAAKDNDNLVAYYDLKEFVESLEKPRIVFMLIMAGKPVDSMIDSLLPLLEEGDIIVDGGNSHFPDTIRRFNYCKQSGINFVGCGVSGGEEGALNGPSMMPGCSIQAWERLKPILQTICAKTDNGEPCCDYIGEDGAGHFVKMVHNGIEYGDMELICEVYQIMKDYLKLSNDEMHDIFAGWNEGKLNSYLIKITSEILAYKENDEYVLDQILDTAGQKGTGKWTSVASLDEGIPLTLITQAVFARCLSAIKEERLEASKLLNGPEIQECDNKQEFIEDLQNALYASKIVSYAQGYSLMKAAAKTYNWNLNYGNIALTWRGGCIIRSVFLSDIKKAFDNNPDLNNLLLDDFFRKQIDACQKSWRKVCVSAINAGIPIPAMSAALNYYDAYRCDRLPANLLQAQRDFFGAHTYERIDKARGEFFHINWTGNGGDISSTAYNR